MAAEAGQSFVVLKDLGENQCVVVGRNALRGEASAVPEVVFFPASPTADAIKVSQPVGEQRMVCLIHRPIPSALMWK